MRNHTATLLALAIVLTAWAAPANAGTAEDPEITDAADDQELPSGDPACPQGSGAPATTNCFLNADLTKAWIDNVTAQDITAHIRITGTGASATLGTAYEWHIHLSVGGTEYVGTVRLNGVTSGGPAGPLDGAMSVSGAAGSATIDAGQINIVIPRAGIGAPADGATITGLYAAVEGYAMGQDQVVVSDRAPDTGNGRDFTLPGSAGTTPPTNTTGPPANSTSTTSTPTTPSTTPSTSTNPSNGTSPTTAPTLGNNETTSESKGSPAGWLAVPALGIALFAVTRQQRRRDA